MARVVRQPGGGSDRLRAAIQDLDSKRAKVGWFETAKYPDGTPVAYVAAIQEFGSAQAGIPPRPFMRPTIEARRVAWRKMLEQGARAVLRGEQTTGNVLELVGLSAAGDIRRTISRLNSPPLAPATIRARQSQMADQQTVGALTKPLVRTGLMISSLTAIVEDK